MARYDVGWGRFQPSGYDRSFARSAPTPWWGTPGYAPRGDYDRGFATEELEGGVYGPGRYGLGPYHQRLRERRRPDEELREEVEDALFYDTWVDADAIRVEVKDGIVTLRGELPDYEEIRYATDDAWDVDGVLGVRSELTVRQG